MGRSQAYERRAARVSESARTQVRGPVQRVEHDDVVPRVRLLDRDGDVLLLGRDHAGAAGRSEGRSIRANVGVELKGVSWS
eukprot:27211-Pelagococcus_subviridis.AAC.1